MSDIMKKSQKKCAVNARKAQQMEHHRMFIDRHRQELDKSVTHTSVGKMDCLRDGVGENWVTIWNKIKLYYQLPLHGKVDYNQVKGQNMNGKTIL